MIKVLPKEEYQNFPIDFRYTTDSHYRVEVINSKERSSITLIKEPLKEPFEKSFIDHIYPDYLDNPIAYGYYVDEKLAGIIEINHETWNNRVRVTECIVFDAYQRQGIGSKLMEYAINKAKELKARAMILETQTCNVPAIDFYRTFGFDIIGLDTIAYHNDSIKRNEVRLELGKVL